MKLLRLNVIKHFLLLLSRSVLNPRSPQRSRPKVRISSAVALRRAFGHGMPQWGRFTLLLTGLLSTSPRNGYAQRQYDAWYFGTASALQFLPGRYWPQVVANSAMDSFESCTSLSDSTTGALLLYSNGERVWDRTHQPMPNGFPLGGNVSASEGALALFAPGQPNLVYLFTTDAKENSVRNSLRYSVVDLRLRNGLGDVGPRNQPLPLPGNTLATEHLAAIRQPNGRDYWILVHGLNNNSFYAYALTPTGIAAQPVASAVGPAFSSLSVAETGVFRFSPSGRQLVTTRLLGGLDIFDFDPQTGRVSNAFNLFTHPAVPSGYFPGRVFGAEFSADGTMLYADERGSLVRYDLLAGSSAALLRSKRLLAPEASFRGLTGSYRRGPNGRIYIAVLGATALSVIDSCNSVNAARLRPASQPLAGMVLPGGRYPSSQYCLPNIPGRYVNSVSPGGGGTHGVEEGFTVVATPGCAGQPTQLEAQLRDPGRQGIQQVQWTIGAAANPMSLSGRRVAPVFGQPGPQPVYVVVTFGDGTRQGQRLQVQVAPLAAVKLQANSRQFVCGEPLIALTAVGSTSGRYTWADDTTSRPQRLLSQAGTYRVRFVSQGGCAATDSLTIGPLEPGTCIIPNVITPNGDRFNQQFVLAGYPLGYWSLTIYNRWGRVVYTNPLYANEWSADGQPAGVYYYLLQHPPTGAKLRGWVEVMR